MPRLLDLFCGAGGAGVGYVRAGWEVVGIDIAPQPRYPFEFWQADAIEVLDGLPRRFHDLDAIHASPPCQGYTSLRTSWNAGSHPLLIEEVRSRLLDIGLPFVIENVPQAPIVTGPPSLFSPLSGVCLCGTMFGLSDDRYELRRHRLFESNVPLPQLPCRHSDKTVVGFYGDHVRIREATTGYSHWPRDVTKRDEKLAYGRTFMGIDWMEWSELAESIPPAYTEWIGTQLLAHRAALAGGSDES